MRVILFEDERPPATREVLLVPVEDDVAGALQGEIEVLRVSRQTGTRREPHKVVGVRKGPRFVEVVDAPDQAPKGIPPGAEARHMKVAYGEHVRGIGQISADLRTR